MISCSPPAVRFAVGQSFFLRSFLFPLCSYCSENTAHCSHYFFAHALPSFHRSSTPCSFLTPSPLVLLNPFFCLFGSTLRTSSSPTVTVRPTVLVRLFYPRSPCSPLSLPSPPPPAPPSSFPVFLFSASRFPSLCGFLRCHRAPDIVALYPVSLLRVPFGFLRFRLFFAHPSYCLPSQCSCFRCSLNPSNVAGTSLLYVCHSCLRQWHSRTFRTRYHARSPMFVSFFVGSFPSPSTFSLPRLLSPSCGYAKRLHLL
ncbi:hypothetical protein, conserved in T. vivax [Trypanosoma vivax Y486]|uniref:Uncharacterized protein n=1 Tax=Trypanosoma vivax (strain Y486) TaxID=1055687 RepID=F9WT84_TRYVY|nr:hypothetical protein, conserved in T. vivax [Trypanosoma vivax Y486]|eukprot:CCD20777.1 hypothetical protein, conserved in T. vivax [Trypanosoma vivax Y486]